MSKRSSSKSGAQSARGPPSGFLPALPGAAMKSKPHQVYQTNNTAAAAAGVQQQGQASIRSRSQGGARTARGPSSSRNHRDRQEEFQPNNMPVLMNTPASARGGGGLNNSSQLLLLENGGAASWGVPGQEASPEEVAVLMLEKNREAMAKKQPTEAIVLLIQAEEMGSRFVRSRSPIGVPTGSAPLHEMVLLTAMTYHNLRTVLIRMNDWRQGLTVGAKALEVDQELLARAIENHHQNPSGNTSMLSKQNPKDQRNIYGATMALASSHLQISTMNSKMGQHSAALESAKASVETLTRFLDTLPNGAEGACSELHVPGAPNARSMEDHPVILLAAATYNLSVELEHAKDLQSAIHVMKRAERHAAMSMAGNHPLRLRISQAAAAQQQQRAASKGRPATSEQSGVSSSSAGTSGFKRNHSGLQQRPASTGQDFGGAPQPPPKNLPKLDLSTVAVLPNLAEGGSSSTTAGSAHPTMVPIMSSSSGDYQHQKAQQQAGGSTMDVTAALNKSKQQQRLSLTSGTVPAQQQQQNLQQQHQQQTAAATTHGRPKPKESAADAAAREKADAVKNQYLVWLEGATSTLFSDYSFRHHAALKIQCAWRSSKAKIEAHNRRQILYHYLHQEQLAAVRCIVGNLQARILHRKFKQHLIEKRRLAEERAEEERKMRNAISKVIYFLRAAIHRRKRNAEIMRRLELEHEEKLKQYDTAAVIIQRWWPIIHKEKDYWRRRSIEVSEEKALEAERRRYDDASTAIGRVWRGRQGRKYAKTYKKEKLSAEAKKRLVVRESIDVIRTLLRENKHRILRLEHQKHIKEQDQIKAVSTIEQGWKECLEKRAMKFINGRARLMQHSACIVQRCFRRYRARRELRVLRVISRTTNEIRLDKEQQREASALRIQCWIRQRKARRVRRKLLAGTGWRIMSALWGIQRIGRGYAARKYVALEDQLCKQMFQQAVEEAAGRRNDFVTRVQSAARGVLSEIMRQKLIHKEQYEELYIYHRMVYERTRDRAATKIQSQVRRCQATKKANQRREDIDVQMNYVTKQVTKLQCFWRVILARRIFAQKIVENMKRMEKKREFELVQNELFVWRSKELDGLESAQRHGLLDKEDQAWAYLLAYSLASGTLVYSNAGVSGSGGGAAPGPGDDDDPHDDPENGDDEPRDQGDYFPPSANPGDESSSDEEGIYD